MRKFGLIGKSLGHSFSSEYFRQKFDKSGIKDVSYLNYEINDIEEVVRLFKENIDGFNVTIPYKQTIIPYLEGIDNDSRDIGAVNCIKRTETGGYFGYNTDWSAFRDTLKVLPQLKTFTRALVLGSGGASKAVGYALTQLDIDYKIISRHHGYKSYQTLKGEDIRDNILIINTTPLGMADKINERPAIDYEAITSKHFLYDLIYNPEKTLFLASGEARGAGIQNGYKMLVLQAEKSWEIWNK